MFYRQEIITSVLWTLSHTHNHGQINKDVTSQSFHYLFVNESESDYRSELSCRQLLWFVVVFVSQPIRAQIIGCPIHYNCIHTHNCTLICLCDILQQSVKYCWLRTIKKHLSYWWHIRTRKYLGIVHVINWLKYLYICSYNFQIPMKSKLWSFTIHI